jgi:hypothetical protein
MPVDYEEPAHSRKIIYFTRGCQLISPELPAHFIRACQSVPLYEHLN